MSRKDELCFETLIPEEDFYEFDKYCKSIYLTKREYLEDRMFQILKENNIDIGVDDIEELYI